MLLFWKIRYLDTRDKQFRDRDLVLDTEDLDPVNKAAVELCKSLDTVSNKREMVRFRHLFRECSGHEMEAIWPKHKGKVQWFLIPDYSEDEKGGEIRRSAVAVALTGDPNAMMFPSNTPSHYVNYIVGRPSPIPLDRIKLSDSSLDIFRIFSRDFREMVASAFCNNSYVSITLRGGCDAELHTQATVDEIRSFVTIFRRLYMAGDPANFVKAAAAFVDALRGYPVAELVSGIVAEYESILESPSDPFQLRGKDRPTGKLLIDVFLYTQYAHQPEKKRLRQYRECLEAVNGSPSILTWLFLQVLQKCCVHIRTAGAIIADFYDEYCRCHGLPAVALPSIGKDNPGLGLLEKDPVRRERLLSEKAEEIAKALWEKAGQPAGGYLVFLDQARAQLTAALGLK
ncbi:MAG: hypothetical protein ABSC42_00415 [Tepidisphaeraceae bacterium]|jgi:hypothetical protein